MRAVVSAVSAIVMCAGSALAGNISPGSPNYLERTLLDGANVPTMTPGLRADVPFDVSGLSSWDAIGDLSNTVLLVDVAALLGLPSGSAVSMTGIGWDVEIETTLAGPFGGSWLSEARFTFGSNAVPNHFGLRPGAGVNNGGTQRFTAGVLNLADALIPDLDLADGILRIELNETFDDANDEIDANYLANSFLTIRAVPAPGALALLGLGGLCAARRRRN